MNNSLCRTTLILLAFFSLLPLFAQQKHIYLANDNHTDYFWSGDADAYREVALREIDFYLEQTGNTLGWPTPYQSRYNLDGAWYAYTYQKYRSPEAFGRLISRIRSGHFSLPFNYLVSTYGGQPTEAVLRGMYWAGRLDREYQLGLNLAASMENQTQPLGLASLWAGAGARYSWKGVCGCQSPVSLAGLANRANEVYRYLGPDGRGVVMKWYDFSTQDGTRRPGGYAEARYTANAIAECDAKCNTPGYPYHIAGAFGFGWDGLQVTDSSFPGIARDGTNSSRQVYVSNETDFFEHFLDVYDINNLPSESWTYGNDWDVNCASLAAPTAAIRNSVEKLRAAEAAASLASLAEPGFFKARKAKREEAYIALGSYWEHNFAFHGCCPDQRNEWQASLQKTVADYVDNLYEDALSALAALIPSPSSTPRFFVFNPLGWPRSEAVNLEYPGSTYIKVIDISNNEEVPHQVIQADNIRYLQILAPDVPSVGYKVFEIQPGPGEQLPDAAALNGNVFENDLYRLAVTREGVITSLVDRAKGRELARETNGRYVNDFGQGAGQAGSLALLCKGPVSATIACTSPNPLQHTTYITLYRAVNRVDILNQITDTFGNEPRTYSFSFNLYNPVAWHEELGAILKAKYTSGGGHYATPELGIRHDWQTLNHFVHFDAGGYGISLSNQGAAFMKLGNSTTNFLDESTAQANVLIGGNMVSPGIPNQGGFTEFTNRFSLQAREGGYSAAQSMKFALEHQNPLIARMVRSENGARLPDDAFSLMQVSGDGILLWALKPAEEGIADGGLVLRLWNMDFQNHLGRADFEPEVLAAYQATHLETDLGPAPVRDGGLLTPVGQQQLQTYRVFLEEPDWGKNDTFPCTGDCDGILEFELYPNPALNQVQVMLRFQKSQRGTLRIAGSAGNILYREEFEGITHYSTISLQRLPAGIYYVQAMFKKQKATKTLAIP